MKVRSFFSGILPDCKNAGWAESVFDYLDRQVKEKLGDKIIIHSVDDKMYRPSDGQDPAIVRVVVYDDTR